MDVAPQKVESKSFNTRVLHLSHYGVLSSPPRQLREYWTLHCDHNWTHMTKDVYWTIKNGVGCRRVCGQNWHLRNLKRFPASGPLEVLAMDVAGCQNVTCEPIRNPRAWQYFKAVKRWTCIKDDRFEFCPDVYRRLDYSLQHSQLAPKRYRTWLVSKFVNGLCSFFWCQTSDDNSLSPTNERSSWTV